MQRLRALAVPLALALVAAGCVNGVPETTTDTGVDALATPLDFSFLMTDPIPFEAAAADGTALRGHVYLPDAAPPFATVLVYWPYWNQGGGEASSGLITDSGEPGTLAGFLGPIGRAGFAVAAINQRGSGASDGCYSYMNQPVNGPDANAVIEALAKEPWSNGRVGMYGISYGGATQYAAIANDPPEALRAVVPVSGEWDEWNLLGRWGVTTAYGGFAHPARRDLEQGFGLLGAPMMTQKQQEPVLFTPEHICPETARQVYEYQELGRTGDRTAFYEERDLRSGIAMSKVPIFATNGMTDGEGHILQFEGLWDLLPEERRLMVGQWGHAFPAGAEAFGREHAAPFFDHYLRDGPKRFEVGVVDYQDNTMKWHKAESWPPPGNRTILYPAADGRLTLDVPGAGSVRFVSQDLTPDSDICGDHQVKFVSPPLAEEVLIAGNFFVHTNLTSTLDDGNLAAWLFTSPGDGGCSDAGDEEVRHAVGDLRHRGGALPKGAPFPTGESTSLTMRSLPLAQVIPAGWRLMLVMGGGTNPDYVMPDAKKPVIDFATGGAGGASLELNIVDGTLRFE